MTIRPCKLCGKTVDFSEPWCDHETMEESAWLDINSRFRTVAVEKATDIVVNDPVEQAAIELGEQASKSWKDALRKGLDGKN